MDLFLQIFLLVNVFLIGALASIAARHAWAHFHPKPESPQKLQPIANVPEVRLPVAVRDRIIHEAEEHFLAQLNQSVAELQSDLKSTSAHLNQQLQQIGSEVAISERGRYYNMLEEVRKQTATALAAAQAEMSNYQAEMRSKMAEEEESMKQKLQEAMKAEQQHLIEQIDTKLADAVGSFLTETLQHNVDLGSQTAYLTALLEEHKEEFKREVADDAPAPK